MCGRAYHRYFKDIKVIWSIALGMIGLWGGILLPYQSQAQDKSIGARIGLARSSWVTTGHVGYSKLMPKNTINFGFIMLFDLPDQNSIQWELNYIVNKATSHIEQQSPTYRSNTSYLSPASSGEFSLSFIEMPLLFRFNFGENSKIFGSLGVNMAYLFNVKHESYTLFDTPSFDVEIYDNELVRMQDFNPFKVGVVFGFGAEFKIGEQRLIADVKNTRTFSNLANTGGINTRTDSYQNLWLNHLTISLAYTFDL